MNGLTCFRNCLLAGALLFLAGSVPAQAQTNLDATRSQTQESAAPHDGQHDFDFEFGTWKIHLKRLLNPLTGSTTWVEFDGDSVTQKVWDGRAQLEQFETDSPVGGHIEGLTLRTYNPKTRQWGLYWANSKDGRLFVPQIGEFKDGRGEFYAQDTINGKSVFIRFIWSNTNTSTPHFEQSFSEDGGKTWEVNWITDQTRVASEAGKEHPTSGVGQGEAKANAAEGEGQRDFDPLIGNWKFHLKRLLNPLTGSTKWVELDGPGSCFKIWDGRAEMDQIELDGPTGHIEGLTLRTYNPQTHEWSLYWANSKDGKVVVPQVGQFKNGRGEFYAQDTLNEKSIFVRFLWTKMNTSTPHFEQSFSDDGGKTWEVNWISDQTRVNDESEKAR